MATGKRNPGRSQPRVADSIEKADVLFMDIVGFSKLFNNDQVALIARFRRSLKAHLSIKRPWRNASAKPSPVGKAIILPSAKAF